MMKILVKAMTTINKIKNKSDQNFLSCKNFLYFDRWSKVQFDVQTHAPKFELKAMGERGALVVPAWTQKVRTYRRDQNLNSM